MHHTATAPGECSDLYRWTRVRFPAPPQRERPPRLWGSFSLFGVDTAGIGRRPPEVADGSRHLHNEKDPQGFGGLSRCSGLTRRESGGQAAGGGRRLPAPLWTGLLLRSPEAAAHPGAVLCVPCEDDPGRILTEWSSRKRLVVPTTDAWAPAESINFGPATPAIRTCPAKKDAGYVYPTTTEFSRRVGRGRGCGPRWRGTRPIGRAVRG